jgi:hypothetical protein
MDLKEAMKFIGDGWVQRPKGFRVRFERREGDQWVSDFFPSESEKPLTSDGMAWELARRFAKASQNRASGAAEGDIASITVVDDKGKTLWHSMARALFVSSIREASPDQR